MSTKVEDAELTEFVECLMCVEKSGTPLLCPSCLHNRRAIGILSKRIKRKETILSLIEKVLSLSTD